MINLKQIDPTDIKDQTLLYDILKYRWRHKDIVNIKNKTPEELPTFEQHVKHINSNNYKKIYRINFNELTIGSIYTDKNNYTGTFLMPSLIKIAMKKYGRKNFTYNNVSYEAHILMYKDLSQETVFYHSINPKNILSLKSAFKTGWPLTEMIFSIKTKNGHPILENENKTISNS
jgi:hypothetical protein